LGYLKNFSTVLSGRNKLMVNSNTLEG